MNMEVIDSGFSVTGRELLDAVQGLVSTERLNEVEDDDDLFQLLQFCCAKLFLRKELRTKRAKLIHRRMVEFINDY